jgi:hypothetical protein
MVRLLVVCAYKIFILYLCFLFIIAIKELDFALPDISLKINDIKKSRIMLYALRHLLRSNSAL